jgi:hypothetical protein
MGISVYHHALVCPARFVLGFVAPMPEQSALAARSIALGAANGGYGSVGFSYSSHPLAMVPYVCMG